MRGLASTARSAGDCNRIILYTTTSYCTSSNATVRTYHVHTTVYTCTVVARTLLRKIHTFEDISEFEACMCASVIDRRHVCQ
jgi:hypothetical protein